jgi:phage terminase large subunit GpA-like protein
MSQLSHAFYRGLTPPPRLTVSQWADQFRMLSPEASAEPGVWNTDRAPFQRAIMDASNDPEVKSVVWMSSSQVGKTEYLLNEIGFTIDLDPSPMLLIQPTLAMAEAFSKDRVDPMLRDTPRLKARVSMGSRKASSTILHKTYPGGHLTMAGANSPASLASRPIRRVLADEVDRWDVSIGGEGDPLALAHKRATNFWNRKFITVSTPTVKGISRIERMYEASDQRRCFLACPHCATRYVLRWEHVKWQNHDPETAHLVCPECGCEIDEAGRQSMLRDPEWRPTAGMVYEDGQYRAAPDAEPVPFRGIAGFHVWEAYSPWRRLSDIVADFLAAKDAPDTLQVFINTSLGESWEQKGEQADVSSLVARREPFPAPVPAGAVVLTCAVDTQDDRLEAQVVGWGIGEESWVVDTRVFSGDPSRPEPWQELDELLAATYEHESGAQLAISATCIDTAGHRTQYVYDYVAKRAHQRVFAIIGKGGSDRPIVSAPAQKRSGKDPRKVPLFTIGVDTCKGLIYSRLKITEKGPGYVHLPLAHSAADGSYRFGVDEEFIAQLTAEKLVTKHVNGVPHRVWIKMRPRNEQGDMANYNIAALRLLRPDLAALAERLNGTVRPKPVTPDQVAAKSRWVPERKGWLRGNR